MIVTCSLPFLFPFWYSNRLFLLAINHDGRIDRTKNVCALLKRVSDKVRDAQMLYLCLNIRKFLSHSLHQSFRFASDYHNIFWLYVSGDVLIKSQIKKNISLSDMMTLQFSLPYDDYSISISTEVKLHCHNCKYFVFLLFECILQKNKKITSKC